MNKGRPAHQNRTSRGTPASSRRSSGPSGGPINSGGPRAAGGSRGSAGRRRPVIHAMDMPGYPPSHEETVKASGYAPSSAAFRSGSSNRKPVRKPNRPYRRRIFPYALAGAVALMIGSFLATHCKLFAIRQIDIEGNHLMSADLIRQSVPIHPGDNLWLTRTAKTRASLLRFAQIEDVHVSHRLPDRVVVQVEERRPWAVIRAAGHNLLIDPAYRVIADAASPSSGLPVVILAAARPEEIPRIGSTVSSRDLLAALLCIREGQIPRTGVSVSRVFIDARRNICLNVNGLGKAVLGSSLRMGPKLATLQMIASRSPGLMRNAELVDLQNPDVPAYRPRPEPKASALETN